MSDQLLIVLSRRGEVAWPTFRRYVNELAIRSGLGERSDAAASIETISLNILKALGHVAADLTGGAGTVWIAPRVLARLPVLGSPRAILVGHRLADTEQELREACIEQHGSTLHAEDDDSSMPLAPRRLMVEANNDASLAEIARKIEARYTYEPSAWRVLQYAGTLADYNAGMRMLPQREPNWSRREFDVETLDFQESVTSGGQHEGLGEYRDPQTGRNRYYLRRSGQTAEVDRDWGRYSVLAAANRNVLLWTDAGEVAVPVRTLLPGPYATGLSLCSGYTPRQVFLDTAVNKKRPILYLVYSNVPRIIAGIAARKLGQQLEMISPIEEAR